MNFNLSEEQGQIRDSIARFVAENYAFEQRNAAVAMEHGFSSENWQQFAELGWLSIPFPEALDGFGGGPVDTMVIMQEFGRGLVVFEQRVILRVQFDYVGDQGLHGFEQLFSLHLLPHREINPAHFVA